jgi:hypothetical protein
LGGVCRRHIIPSSRSEVRWLADLDSDHGHVKLNVIYCSSTHVGWSDLRGFAGFRCISTHRFVTGYYSQSRWLWYVRVLSSSLQKFSWSTRPDSCRRIKTLHCHPTPNYPEETHESSAPRTVSMTTPPTTPDHTNVKTISQTRCSPCPGPSRDRCQVSHSTTHLPRNFTTPG